MSVAGRTHRPVVDPELCQACGVCLKACPARFLPGLRSQNGTIRGRAYAQAASAATELLPPCDAACPIGQKPRAYIRLLAQGRAAEALLAIRRTNPLPWTTAHVCHHPCEEACLRGLWEGPVAVRGLKRAACALECDHPEAALADLEGLKAPSRNRSVAVIGAGPAGLACAWQLTLLGLRAEVLDAQPLPGGMLRLGIPPFRLPREALERDLDFLKDLGVRFHANVKIGTHTDLSALRGQGYDAVVVATGTHANVPLEIPGGNAEGVLDWLHFLERAYNGAPTGVEGRRVLVVGGGNAAFDVARTALRAGAVGVEMIMAEGLEDLTAQSAEVRAAQDEGVRLRHGLAPTAVAVLQGRVAGLDCVPARLGLDAAGRRRPIPTGSTPLRVAGDVLLPAVGQRLDLSLFDPRALSPGGTLRTRPDQQISGEAGLFAAGDALTGPTTVVEAMASGMAAACAVARWLENPAGEITA